MIRFVDVSKQFGSFTAVDNLNLEIFEKELCVLVGPSGSGKSTLLRMINHLVEPTRGSIILEGRPVSSLRPEILRRNIGYVIQSVGLFPHMTVAQNVAVVPHLLHWKKSRISARVEELLGLVGLDPRLYARRSPLALSGGEAQRVGVARALAADPPVLLMDEPFSAVDPVTRLRLQGDLLSLQKNLRKTIVFVTHDVDEAIRLADRVSLVKDGRLVQYDRPEVLLESPVNGFVADFLGADRALKRLSRFLVSDYLGPAASAVWDGKKFETAATERYLWVTEPSGRLLGSWDRSREASPTDPFQAVSTGQLSELAIRPDASLKEALSTMIGSGARSLPVVDFNFCIVGEISLADVERAAENRR